MALLVCLLLSDSARLEPASDPGKAVLAVVCCVLCELSGLHLKI